MFSNMLFGCLSCLSGSLGGWFVLSWLVFSCLGLSCLGLACLVLSLGKPPSSWGGDGDAVEAEVLPKANGGSKFKVVSIWQTPKHGC